MHTDPEVLSLLALGEDAGTEEDRAHAETCADCAAELAELRRVVDLGRSADADTGLSTPSPTVWRRIRDELGLEPVPVQPLVGGSSHQFEHEPTAHVALTPVDPRWSSAFGEAELVTDEHGRRLLQVALHADVPSSGLQQAWLVHRDNPNVRQSLGVLDGPHGLWTVAHSIDLEQFAILDISQQGPGETDHSGHTIVRGQLTLAG